MTASPPDPDNEPEEDPQPDLIPLPDSGPLSFFSENQELEIQGLSTGEGIKKRNPRMYDLVVRLLGQAAPVREIKRLTGLHHRTIMSIREREGETIDTLRKELGARALRTAALAVEAMEERIMSGNSKLGELAVAGGILIERGQLLTGGATSRAEKVESERVEDKLRDLLQSLPMADARLIDDAGNTGMGGGNVSAKDGPDLAGADPVESPGVCQDEAAGENQSPVQQCKSSHDADCDADLTDKGADERSDAGGSEEGGGGGPAFEGGACTPNR